MIDMRLGLSDVGPTEVGFSMGFDHVSEHEWGIKRLKSSLGVNASEDAYFADRVISNTDSIRFIKKKSLTAVTMTSIYGYDEASLIKQYNLSPKYNYFARNGFVSYWDENRFLLAAFEEPYKAVVEELYTNIMKKRVVPLISAKMTGKSGLNFVYLDKLPEFKIKEFDEDIDDNIRLKAESEKTGIHDKLNAAGKKYFACSPRWSSKFSDIDTKYPVVYWLNPYEQDTNNFGWFTVEDLELWIEGKGPVPKKKQK
jgi:YHS domain-containing protein